MKISRHSKATHSCQKSQKPVGKGGEFQWDFPSCTVVVVWLELIRARVTSPFSKPGQWQTVQTKIWLLFWTNLPKEAEKVGLRPQLGSSDAPEMNWHGLDTETLLVSSQMLVEQRQPPPLHTLLSAPACRLSKRSVVIKRGLIIYLLSRDAVDLRRKGMTSQALVQLGAPLAEWWTFLLRASITSCAEWVTMSLCPLEEAHATRSWKLFSKCHGCCSCLSPLEEAESSERVLQPLLNMLLLVAFTFFTVEIVN